MSDFLDGLYKNIGAIIGFLVIVIVFETAFGAETTNKMLLLVLLGSVLYNADEFIEFIS